MERTEFNNLAQLENGTPSDRFITLKSVYKTGKTTVQPVSDGTGWYMGVARLSEDEKRGKTHWAEPTSKFVIKDGVTFDLNVEAQRITWEWVKHCPCIAPNEEACQHTPAAEFYVYLENEVAAKNITRKELKYEAIGCIMNDNAVNYPMRAELFGVNMDYARPSVIKDFLLDQAEATPEKVIQIYKGADVSIRLLLLKARKNAVIVVDDAGFYRYGSVVLGMSEKSAVDWLQDKAHKHLIERIEKETNPEYFVKDEPVIEQAGPTGRQGDPGLVGVQLEEQTNAIDLTASLAATDKVSKPVVVRGGGRTTK
jgi:hypothetical protein